METRIVAFVDKTVVKITGVKVRGLKPYELEQTLKNQIGRPVRVIGVTGDAIEMDIYGLEPEALYRDEQGIVKAVSMVSGITAAEVIKIASAEKSVEVSIERVPKGEYPGCAKERWLNLDQEGYDHPDRG